MMWEDDPPAEPRVRRVQQSAPRAGRNLPGMPVEMEDPDADDDAHPSSQSRVRRFPSSESKTRWWRPSSKIGRIVLTLAALTVVGGLATAALALRTYIERDSRFRIAGANNIQATGLTEVSRAEMLPAFGEDIGRNIFFVPLDERRKQLESIPWVERATVMRLLPDQIRVTLVERQPVAFTRQGQQIGLVDANGVLLTMPAASMAKHHYSFPVVTGIDAGDPAASRRARMAVYLRLMADLDSTGQHFSQQISEIDLTDPEDARVLMPEQGSDILAHLGDDRFLDRYQRYQAHISEWRQQYPHLAAVDLRYNQQVVLQMASGKETSEATPGAAVASAGDPAAPKPRAGELATPASPAAVVARSAVTPAKKPSPAAAKARAAQLKAQEKKKRAEHHAAQPETRRNSAGISHTAAAAGE
jgi:cell division protein FtsQ